MTHPLSEAGTSADRLRTIASAIAADVLGNDHLRHKLDEQQADEVHGDVQTIAMRHLSALIQRTPAETVGGKPFGYDNETGKTTVTEEWKRQIDALRPIPAEGDVAAFIAAAKLLEDAGWKVTRPSASPTPPPIGDGEDDLVARLRDHSGDSRFLIPPVTRARLREAAALIERLEAERDALLWQLGRGEKPDA